jgi:hypothetical protein
MIPTIEDIIAGLIAGRYNAEQAEAWISRHVEIATDEIALRDHFAGAALPAVITACASDTRKPGEAQEEYFARRCWHVADAMLAARSA